MYLLGITEFSLVHKEQTISLIGLLTSSPNRKGKHSVMVEQYGSKDEDGSEDR